MPAMLIAPTPSPFYPEPRRWTAVETVYRLPDGRGGAPEGPAPKVFPGTERLDWNWALHWARAFGGLNIRWSLRSDLGPQAYTLAIDSDGIEVGAADGSGAWFAAITLGQWVAFALRGHALQGLQLEDAPAVLRRGYMLDISRDRVPTRAALARRLDSIARLKGNHVELYTEHTFAYAGHSAVHAGYSPMTVEDVRWLQNLATSRGIELIPNQNTFGHMHRWLRCRPYRHLAEQPEGDFHAFDYEREPFSLCPTDPGSLALVRDLFGQLLPLFEGPFVQGGLDETFDVGRGRSREAAERDGIGTLYGTYLKSVAALAREHGKRLAYWADIVLEHPEVLDRLPPDGVAVLWGYEADHPLAEQAQTLHERGVEFWIAAGTSAWQSLTGRWSNAQANIASAVQAALRFGASGLVLTDWGDYGHWQPYRLSDPAILTFFARAWNPDRPLEADAAHYLRALGAWCWGDSQAKLAGILWDTVRATDRLQDGARNGTGPFYALRYPPHGPNPKESWTARAPRFDARGAQAYRERLAQLRLRLQRARGVWRADFEELDAILRAADWATAVAQQRLEGTALSNALVREGRAVLAEWARVWSHSARPGGLWDARRKWQHALSPAEWSQGEPSEFVRPKHERAPSLGDRDSKP